ncbi:sulfite exporter TauE/SafE family protein [Pseudomonas alliivorans]|nr:sulfite exporter TauE/SafE family protein [Pseudomonas alliivorans]MEE4836135.1 sulfite exporter TauE/SafE family protein [Pseudomonas alliivorans]MEE4927709.1 sulfite exporter TauE/SafE family protein [Pseudomonas alliivorans]
MNTLFDTYQTLGVGLIALVFGTFLLAGTVKGVIGLGLPTVSMGLLGLAMLPAQAAALLIIPSIVTNFWQLATGGHLGGLIRRLWPMLATVFAGTLAGSFWLGMNGDHSMTQALGGALLLYTLSGLFLPMLKMAATTERWLGPLCGLLTGVITSATGVFVIPAVPYLQALGLERHQLVQALGLSFTVSTLALAIGLSSNNALGSSELGASLLALIPALLGMLIGQWLRERISAAVFKRTFFIGMALLGLHLLMKG